MSSTTRISPVVWDAHKEQIQHLYLNQDKTLAEVMQHMAHTSQFYATKAQYVRRLKHWNVEKNSTSKKWELAAELVRKRKAEGKQASQLLIDGKPIPLKKMKKELGRHHIYPWNRRGTPDMDKAADEGVVARTPPAVISLCHNMRNIMFHSSPWLQLQALLTQIFLPSAAPTHIQHMYTTPTTMQYENHHADVVIRKPLGEILGFHPKFDILDSLPDSLLRHTDAKDHAQAQQLSRMQPDLQLFTYAIYLSSNNFLGDRQTDNMVKWLVSTKKVESLKVLLKAKTPATEVVAESLLRSAIRLEDYDLTRTLLRAGTRVDDLPKIVNTETALQLATRRQNLALVELLMEAGADPNTTRKTDGGYETALSLAITSSRGCLDVVKALIKGGARVDSEFSQGPQNLSAAVQTDDVELVQVLIDSGAYVHGFGNSEGTALQIAARMDRMDLVDVLLRAGAHVDIRLEDVRHCVTSNISLHQILTAPVQSAARNNNLEMVQCLLEAGANPDGSVSWEAICRDVFWPRLDDERLDWPWDDSFDEEDVVLAAREMGQVGIINTPLQEAANHCNTQLVELLCDAGADVDAISSVGSTVLPIVCESDQPSQNRIKVVKQLLNKGVCPDTILNGKQTTSALQAATASDDMGLVRLLLEVGADINAPPAFDGGRTAIQAAVGLKDKTIFWLLLERGADINARAAERNGRTCLQIASEQGDVVFVEILLQCGADINAPASPDCGGRTALQAAVDRDHEVVYWRLLELGADVNAPHSKEKGCCVLCAAINNENGDLVNLLLSKGANPDPAVCRYYTPLTRAIGINSPEMVAVLLQAGAQVNRWSLRYPEDDAGLMWTPLGAAAEQANCPLTLALLEARAEASPYYVPDFSDLSDGRFLGSIQNPLVAAVKLQSLATIKLLLSRGANPNQNTGIKACDEVLPEYEFFEPALHAAIGCRYYEDQDGDGERTALAIVQELIGYGADVNMPSGTISPLSWAVRQDRTEEIVPLLLRKGAEVNGSGNLRDNPLVAAISSGRKRTAKRLLEAGANIHTPASELDNGTALQAAVEVGAPELVQDLLSRGADVNAPGAEYRGGTALQLAAMTGNLKVAMMLLEAGADINAAPAVTDGRTALQGAAEQGRSDMVHLLLENDKPATLEEVQSLQERCEEAAKFAAREGHSVLARILREWRYDGE
ncbi:hypothetical protein G7046_g743 [Stylonectria norvegica]|nr:hypothetical protein G7046_g743 [Stylonectria norvegica]